MSTMPFLWVILHQPYWIFPAMDIFIPLILTSYKMLNYISYNLEYLNGNCRSEDEKPIRGLFRMFYYAFYMPYLISLIVLYPDFVRQIAEKNTRQRNWRKIIWYAVRMAFWFN